MSGIQDVVHIISREDTSNKNDLYIDMRKQFTYSDVQINLYKSTKHVDLQVTPKAIIFHSTATTCGSVQWIREYFPTAFIGVFQPELVNCPETRYKFFKAGANMVSYDTISIIQTITNAVFPTGKGGGTLTCPFCGLTDLTEDELWYHMPAFHINVPNEKTPKSCPICNKLSKKPIQVHVHDNHGPEVRRRALSGDQSRIDAPVTLHSFALVVCKHPTTGEYLLCQEFGDQGFWIPGGHVDPGESMIMAAKRETIEEAGIDVDIKGILTIQYIPFQYRNGGCGARVCIIFYAEPEDLNQLPKSCPDFESAGACWSSYESIMNRLKLRGKEPRKWAKYLEEGGQVHPLSLLVENY